MLWRAHRIGVFGHKPQHGVDVAEFRMVLMGHPDDFLDNVIDRNRYPLPEIEEQTLRNRRIGLGVMGWADLLIKLGLPYDDDRSVRLAEKVMGFIQEKARNQSSELAKTRGKFPSWAESRFAEDGIALRNATLTTVAPTGTISIIAGCSSGIEPYYAVAFERHVMDGPVLALARDLDAKPAGEPLEV